MRADASDVTLFSRVEVIVQKGLLFALSACGVIAFTTASLAYPEEERRTPAFTLDWETRPTGGDFERHYPPNAAESGQGGVAILCCSARADGSLDCSSAYESPGDAGFGQAAVRIAQAFRMKPADASTWSASGEQLRVPIWFLMNTSLSNRRVQAAQAEVFQATQSICVAPVS